MISKAVSMFEEDERFKALDRPAEREDLFKNYLVDLQKKVVIVGPNAHIFQPLRMPMLTIC